MKKFNFHYFPRDFEAGNFIENFLVSTVTSILIIRVYLQITGFPKIQTQDFYIQHMLFGGFIMMLTLISLLVFLNREIKFVGSITGGVGFGVFIDELGKFITKDNNYFYQPTIALIYVILILIFLTARAFEKYVKLTETEYAVNAMELAKNAIVHDLDTEEKQRALYLLKHTNRDDHIARFIEKALLDIRAKPTGGQNVFHLLKNFFKNLYLKLIRHRYFIRITVSFFVISAILNFFNSLYNFTNIKNFADWGQLVFSLVSGFLVLFGSVFLWYKSSRKIAYEAYKLAVLVSIFLTQFFRFLENQITAVFILILSLIVLSVLQYLIYEESLIIKKSN